MPTRSPSAMHYLYCLLLLGAAAPASTAGYDNLFLVLAIVVTVYLIVLCDQNNIFQMLFMCGHCAFFAYPVLLYGYFGKPISSYVIILCLLGTLAAIMASQIAPAYARTYDRLRISFFTYFIVFFAYSVLLVATQGGSYLYTIPYIVIAFHLFTLGTPRHHYLLVGIAYVLGIMAVLIFFVLFSGGFGRLALGSPIFIITLMLVNWLRLPFGKIALLGAVFVGSFLGSVVRSDVSWDFSLIADVAAKDSIASPILILDLIYRHSLGGFDVRFADWLSQMALFFLAAIPRALWESKPNGFGFAYTQENLAPYLIDAGYSIAAIFPGEHVYYLGPVLGVAGTLVAVVMVCLLWRFFCRYLNGYLAVGVAVHLPTFYWGGVQAYAGRNLLWLLPALTIGTFFQLFAKKAHRRPAEKLAVNPHSPLINRVQTHI